ADAKGSSRGSHLVTFDPCPEPEVENDAEAEAQDFLAEAPEFVVNLLPSRLVPGGGAEGPEPFILGEAHGGPGRGELPRECGLTRPRQSAGENESGLGHGVVVQQLGGLSEAPRVLGHAAANPGRCGTLRSRPTGDRATSTPS